MYEEEKIKELGMDAFLAVGKVLTYDSGGYSIKPTSSMVDMKTDMAGAASVIGAMCRISREKVNKIPVFDEYKKHIKGVEADLKNSGGREAGCITAGLFIVEFVGNTPCIYMDIVGTSTFNNDKGYKYKGATGESVRTLFQLAKCYK